MSRRRLTWNGRKASAPPAMPGYQEPSVHPAAYPDPEADAYENGDTSSWAEDPHPGPYPNTFHPALPGTEEPMGHPATDPAHYFPAGVTKQASRQLRAAMEAKAAKCIRIAQSMLGRKASVSAIEDQALDLMNLTERQIQASLKRLAEDGMAQDVPGETASDLLALDNYTLTPERSADDLLLENMMAEEEAGHDAGDDHDADLLAEMLAEEEAGHHSGYNADEQLLANMMAEEQLGSRMASRRRRAFGVYDQMPGDQNAPAHYNFRAEGVLASKKSDDADVEAEELLADMVKQEARKAFLRRQAKKSEDTEADEVEADEVEADEAPAKKAAHFQRLAAYWARVAKKSEDTEADEDTTEADKKASSRKAAIRRLAGLELSADVKEALAALLKAEDVEPVAGEEPVAADDADPTADDFLMDDMGLDPMLVDDGIGGDELSMLYGGRVAKKSEEETTEADGEEPVADDAEAPKAEKKAAVRPQPRKASNGPKTLGTVAKVASGDVNDLSKLWESAPDVSKIFG
jgi:hypothetical protein